jgi:hypothetical protein
MTRILFEFYCAVNCRPLNYEIRVEDTLQENCHFATLQLRPFEDNRRNVLFL